MDALYSSWMSGSLYGFTNSQFPNPFLPYLSNPVFFVCFYILVSSRQFLQKCEFEIREFMWWAIQNIRTSTYMAIGIPKIPSMAKQSKISHGKLFRILLSTCSWLKLCFVISQAYRTRPRTIKSMTCRIPYSVKCTSNKFITRFSRILNLRIHEIISQNFAFHFLEGCKWYFVTKIVLTYCEKKLF